MRSWSSRRSIFTAAAITSGLLVLTAAAPVSAQQPAAPGTAKPAAGAPAAKPAGDKPAGDKAGAAKPAGDKAGAAKPAGDKAVATDKPAGDKAAAGKTADKPAKPLTEKQKKDRVKKAFKEAEEKFGKGDYAGALELYREADSLLPGAPLKFKIASALDKMGNVKEAVAAYEAFLAASPDPEKLKTSIEEANARMNELKKTPAKVKLAVTPPEATALKVAVDGVDQPLAAGNELSIAPGKHKVSVQAEGYEPSEQEFEVSFADTKELPLTLNKKAEPPPPEPVAVAPPPPPPPAAPPPAPPPPPRSKVPAYVTLGFAGAGAIVGTIFGVQALGAKSDFDSEPTTENADRADRNALIADMSFAVAITFGVTGAVLLFSKDAPDQPKAASVQSPKPKPAPRRAFVTPYVGPTGGGAAAKLTF